MLLWWLCQNQQRIVKKNAPGKGILYADLEYSGIEASSNVDWASSLSDRRLTTAYCVFVGGKSHGKARSGVWLQGLTRNTNILFTQTTCELVWIHNPLREIGTKTRVPLNLWGNNRVAIHIFQFP